MHYIKLMEFNITKNCNLNCKGCNHFSTLTNKKEVLAVETVKKDLQRLRDLGINIGRISLLGGEPLLLDNLNEYIDACRSVYPEPIIEITTNGLLVSKLSEKVISALKGCNVVLVISLYPILKRQNFKKEIEKFLKDKKVNYRFIVFKNRFRKQLSTEVHTKDLRKYCLCGTPTLEDGKLYACPVSAYIYKLNNKYNYNFPSNEYIDIYDENVDVNKICNVDKVPIELCKYCSQKDISTFKWEGYCYDTAKASDWVMSPGEKRTPSYHIKRKIVVKLNSATHKLKKMISNK